MSLEQATEDARELNQRRQSGFDQAALDEAARLGTASGAFEDWRSACSLWWRSSIPRPGQMALIPAISAPATPTANAELAGRR